MNSRGLSTASSSEPAASRDIGAVGLVVSVVALAMALAFWRGSHSVFTVPKWTVLVVGVLVLFAVRLFQMFGSRREDWAAPWTTWPALLLGVLLGLSAIASPQASEAMWGSNARLSGVFTWWCYLALFVMVGGIGDDRRSLRLISGSVGLGTVGVAAYAAVQGAGLDPFSWATSLSFGVDAKSTLGNPNFAGAHLAIGLPILVAGVLADRSATWTRAFLGAGIGVSAVGVALASSTQGDIGVVLSLTVGGCWVLMRSTGRRWRAALLLAPLGLLIVAIPTVLRGSATGVWVLTIVSSALWGALVGVLRIPAGNGWSGARLLDAARRRRPLMSAGLLVVPVVLVGVAPRLLAAISGGMAERRYFWSVGWEMFLERPILGHGLETFGLHFTRLRPMDHADASPTHLSDSVHNIPLGLLIGGGLLSFLAYLLLLATVVYFGFLGIRRARGDDRLLLVAVGASWIAFQIQSLVSVDTVGLGYLQWVLGGLLVASGSPRRRRLAVRDRLPDWVSGPLVRWAVPAVLVVGLVVALVGPTTAPLRADVALSKANWAVAENDVEMATIHFDTAIRLQPGNVSAIQSRALIHRLRGEREASYQSSVVVAEMRPGVPGPALQAARDAVLTWSTVGRLAEARRWYRLAILADPFSAGIVAEVVEFLESTGRVAEAEQLRFELAERRSGA